MGGRRTGGGATVAQSAAAPIEKRLLVRSLGFHQETEEGGDEFGIFLRRPWYKAEAIEDGSGDLVAKGGPKTVECRLQQFDGGEGHKGFGEPGQIPGEGIGLP